VGLVSRPQTIHDFGGFDPALYDVPTRSTVIPSWRGVR
jgi:aromatic ring-opening dioxygenase catalytic subunit (LigB family)